MKTRQTRKNLQYRASGQNRAIYTIKRINDEKAMKLHWFQKIWIHIFNPKIRYFCRRIIVYKKLLILKLGISDCFSYPISFFTTNHM